MPLKVNKSCEIYWPLETLPHKVESPKTNRHLTRDIIKDIIFSFSLIWVLESNSLLDDLIAPNMEISLIKLQSMKIIPTQWAMAKWQQISLKKILVSQAEKLWLSWAHTLWADYTTKSAYLDTYGPLEDKPLLTINITSKFSKQQDFSYISLNRGHLSISWLSDALLYEDAAESLNLLHYFQLITRYHTLLF